MNQSQQSNELIVICGPTASGKTAIFESMVANRPGHYICINADTGQMYRRLQIGTAKPELASSQYEHYLFDLLDYGQLYTAALFRQEVERLCQQIWQQNKTPVIVGGSMFYINSLFYPPHDDVTCLQGEDEQPSTNQLNPNALTSELYAQLKTIDPNRAAQVMPNDRYRILRALEIWQTYRVLPSSLEPIFKPLPQARTQLIWVNPGIEQLSANIAKRLGLMLTAGWIDEVIELSQDPAFKEFVLTSRLIGYKEIVAWLEAGNSINDQAQLKALETCLFYVTRNYAKKQLKFWRRLQQKINRDNHLGRVSINAD